MLDQILKKFPKKEALKTTVATVVSYKASKYISNMLGEKYSVQDPTKKPMWELIGAVGTTAASIFAHVKMKDKDIGYGLVIGTGVNLVDKTFLLPAIKKSIPESMQPLFSGIEQSPNDLDPSEYQRRVGDARYQLSEEDVKGIINQAKVNGYLAGFGDLGEDVIVLTPEERSALIEQAQMSGNGEEYFSGEENDYEPYERPLGLAGEEMDGDGDEDLQ